jgi:hypothetical protein
MGIGAGLAAARALEQNEQQDRCHAHPGEDLESIRVSQNRCLPLGQARQGLIGSRLRFRGSQPATRQQALHLAQLLLLERIIGAQVFHQAGIVEVTAPVDQGGQQRDADRAAELPEQVV